MPRIVLVAADGVTHTVEAAASESIMQATLAAGIDGIVGECGGSMMCATCHVYVREPWAAKLPAMTATESEMLTMTVSERKPSSRLSCQIKMSAELDGITVDLPENQV